MVINGVELQTIIDEKLKPFVKKVDEEAFYARDYLQALGEAGFLNSSYKSDQEVLFDEIELVKETAKVCMTTAFCLWCHLASLTYIRKTNNSELRKKVLPGLENGEVLGATGLSNPMKFYAGLEKLHLQAKRVDGGYIINGVLPAVSNLGENHWFGAIAGVSENEEVMVFVNTSNESISLKERANYIGLNGSATFSCRFNDVFVPDHEVIARDARTFVDQIRPIFVIYQIPLGVGVMESAVVGIDKVCAKQNGCNRYLQTQSQHIQQNIEAIEQTLEQIVKSNQYETKEICKLRLQTAYDTLAAVQANMLHNGSAGYVNGSAPSRKLREAYFFANLTPTVRQLEKMVN